MKADLDGWCRLESETVQFYATDADVSRWLQEGLPTDYGPYFLVGQDVTRLERKRILRRPFAFDVAEFARARHRTDGTPVERRMFFIFSSRLSGNPPPVVDTDNLDAYYSLNGLISLVLGGRRKNRIKGRDFVEDSSFGIVESIVNHDQDKVIVNAEYKTIYRSLLEIVERDLVYATVLRPADDSRQSECTLIRMTQHAAAAYAEGVPYLHKPGRRLRQGR
jgi:hypothetical protein